MHKLPTLVRSLSLLAVLWPIVAQADQPPVDVRLRGEHLQPTRLVAYKSVAGRDLHLHVFEPLGHRATDRRACLLVIHGGGWRGGDPRQFYVVADYFARRAMLAVSLEYRLPKHFPGSTPYDCVADGRSAVRYLRQHAAELGIDPQKIIASGGSAGGHVAAGAALFGPIDPDEDESVSCVPDALVLFYPVIDTSSEGYGRDRLGQRWQDISPLHQVRPGAPPTLIFHGTSDTVTPYKGAQAFQEAMIRAGNRCELVSHPGGRHGHIVFDEALFDDALRRTEAFLDALHLTTPSDGE